MRRPSTTEHQRLVRVWRAMGVPRAEAEHLAAEDQRVALVFREQGMTARQVRATLAKLRSIYDLIEVDARGRCRLITSGRSIFDLDEPPQRRTRRTRKTTKGAE